MFQPKRTMKDFTSHMMNAEPNLQNTMQNGKMRQVPKFEVKQNKDGVKHPNIIQNFSITIIVGWCTCILVLPQTIYAISTPLLSIFRLLKIETVGMSSVSERKLELLAATFVS